jgi:hypothetical protein
MASILGVQCFLAREALGWTMSHLAQVAEVSPQSVAHFEPGGTVKAREIKTNMEIRDSSGSARCERRLCAGGYLCQFRVRACAERTRATGDRGRRRLHPGPETDVVAPCSLLRQLLAQKRDHGGSDFFRLSDDHQVASAGDENHHHSFSKLLLQQFSILRWCGLVVAAL